jgi:ribosomal protein S27AE
MHTLRPHWPTCYIRMRTVLSLTVQCAQCAQSAHTDPLIRAHCGQCAHLQYSAHSAAVAPTMSSVFQHILHGALALLSLFQYAKQCATTAWQTQVPAKLLNFKLIAYLACFPSVNELFIKSLCTYLWVSANRQSF